MTTTEATVVPSEQQPRAGTWYIDPVHSSVNFSARHLGLSKVRGVFGSFGGTITVADEVTGSQVDVQVHTESVDTGQEQRDAHLRSPDFLDIANHPTMDFRGHTVEDTGDGYRLVGDLTIRGTTRPVTLDVEYGGLIPDPLSGGHRIAFNATTSIDRRDFGLTWNAPLETGQILVGHRVTIELDVVAGDQRPKSPEETQAEAASSEETVVS